MTTPSITELLKYADLQMAAEAFLTTKTPPYVLRSDLLVALTDGNNHASKFTELQAKDFLANWEVLAQQPNTETGFSGTLFRRIKDDPLTGAKAGELVMSFRSTEFIDDAARDNQATNDLEIKETGFAWGQIRDMEAWYTQLSAEGGLLAGQPFNVTGYSLGGHLATVFNQLHPGAAQQVVTFNGAGVGAIEPGWLLKDLVDQFTAMSVQDHDELIADEELSAIYRRVRETLNAGQELTASDNNALYALAHPSPDAIVDFSTRDQARMVIAAAEMDTDPLAVSNSQWHIGTDVRVFIEDQPLVALTRRWQTHIARFKRTLKLALLGGAVVALSACGTSASSRGIDKSRQETAIVMWKERCQKAGEFIHQTVEDVEGVYLMKLRPKGPNFADQFMLDDPYGDDVYGMGLVNNFLRQAASPDKPSATTNKGYRYVVAKDINDGQLYRFTGSWVSTRKKDVTSPWIQAELKKNPNFDLNIYDFVLQKAPPNPLPRYSVTWDDISTREEREYWIAGSSLKVIDLQTNKVIAERVGYMVDWAQGSKAGNRSPWGFAADTSCPSFRQDPSAQRVQPAFTAQTGQTYRFVSKVLKPKQ